MTYISVLGSNISFLFCVAPSWWTKVTANNTASQGLYSHAFRVLGVNTERAEFLRERPTAKLNVRRHIKKWLLLIKQCPLLLPHLLRGQNAGAFHLQRLTFPAVFNAFETVTVEDRMRHLGTRVYLLILTLLLTVLALVPLIWSTSFFSLKSLA